MRIYPAIDILGHRCVRLRQGDYDQVTVYGDPLQMALIWKAQGAQVLHVVDLDGAHTGQATNALQVRAIVRETGLDIQLGGGIRSLEQAEKWIKLGVQRVVVGTLAIESPELVAKMVQNLGSESIAVAIDARNGLVATQGWREQTKVAVESAIASMQAHGVRHFLYTDIHRDGMLTEPNYEMTRQVVRWVDGTVVASGGVGSVRAITELGRAGVAGVVVGKALYDNLVTLPECLAAAEQLEEGEP